MKTVSTLALVFLTCLAGHAQKVEKYYNYNWKETDISGASFYSMSNKTDSGWLRKDYYIHRKTLQMQALYTDSSCKVHNGMAYYFYPNGNLESVGRVIDGKKQGQYFSYYSEGMMKNSITYLDNEPVGTSIKWAKSGYMTDSAFYNKDGSGIEMEWFDDGRPSAGGRYAAGYKKHGKWNYYHHNGQLSCIELYNNGNLLQVKLFDETGNAVSDTANRMMRAAAFPKGIGAWTKYLQKQLYFPSGYKIVNSDLVAVVAHFTLSEDGSVEDAEISVPFYPEFEKIALDVIKKSPKWIPAMLHNRPVKYRMRQTVSFSQSAE
ncbi:energy transducer TonB [Danxiaibacter flavus]|uniref:Energy transducer TonB n=1 Tax=Danxiaibacter flavus TaxID=3049108 RepID=A0ABV3ZMS8_9BACT|nr:energy transducer TonB [Chitinophagaceae bacterium DXS]